jgi:hypothetical protein
MSEDRGDGATTDAAATEEDVRRVREAEEAHGGSMAPDLVDETGHPVAEPPPADPE